MVTFLWFATAPRNLFKRCNGSTLYYRFFLINIHIKLDSANYRNKKTLATQHFLSFSAHRHLDVLEPANFKTT